MLIFNRPLLDSCVHECDILLTVRQKWNKPPSGWDSAVTFLDPNNNKGVQTKPKHEVLMQMFDYLLELYQVSNMQLQSFQFIGCVFGSIHCEF